MNRVDKKIKHEKSCGCIIVDNNKVLLVKHILGHWDFPKGHLQNGETEFQTAIREVKEETNIEVEIHENYRYTIEYITQNDIHKEVVYFMATKKSNMIMPQQSEIQEVQWVDISEAMEKITFETTRNLFKKVIDDLNSRSEGRWNNESNY